MAILSWVNLGGNALLMVLCVVLCFDAMGQRRALTAMRVLLDAHGAELLNVRQALAYLAPDHPALAPVDRGAASVARSEARERQLPPGSTPAPAVDTSGDRRGINPGSPLPTEAREEPPPDTDREPSRAAPLDVAQALGAPPGMVGLSLEESDAAQAPEPEIPARRSLRTESPSEPPPAGVPVPTDDPEAVARWRRTLRRHPIMDEVTARGTLRALDPATVATIAPLSPDELDTVDRMAAARGISREAMTASLAGTGIAAEERRAGPTTPPGGPANDAPPPSGRRRT